MSSRAVNILMFVFIILTIIAIMMIQYGYGLVFVSTPSVPTGLYIKMGHRKQYHIGQMVLFSPLPAVSNFMVKRGWVTSKTLLVKYVYAVPGNTVCIRDSELLVDHHSIAKIFSIDSKGRGLPTWDFCGTVPEGQLLLLSTRRKNSFDSRYFGFVADSQVVSLVSKVYGGEFDA